MRQSGDCRSKETFMRGDQKVIEQLNIALSGELTAIVQYMVQAEICGNWGYGRLAGLTKARAIQEMTSRGGADRAHRLLRLRSRGQYVAIPTIGRDVRNSSRQG